jgi:glyoxylase-like metal-dependent hydrolase (beta-lactamase superfamily II)
MKAKRLFIKVLPISLWFLSILNWVYAQDNSINNSIAIKVDDGFYMIPDYGCNIGVMVGKEGLLIIDSGYEETASKMDSSILALSNLPLRYVLNTHMHFDHVGGNKKLAEKGAIIISNDFTRKHMLNVWDPGLIAGVKLPTIQPYPESYLPKICFNDSLSLYFNSDTIKAYEFKHCHTGGEVIYYFQKANVIYTGDLFLSEGFPGIMVFDGGTINGSIKAIGEILKMCNEKTIVIPGHGHLSNRQGLEDYHELMINSRDIILKLINEGKTLDEIIKLNPINNLYKGEVSGLTSEIIIHLVYQDLYKK